MGYGTRAIKLLEDFYNGRIEFEGGDDSIEGQSAPETISLQETEELRPRKQLPPLLSGLEELRPPRIDWLGVSFGLSPNLLK